MTSLIMPTVPLDIALGSIEKQGDRKRFEYLNCPYHPEADLVTETTGRELETR